MNTFHQIAQQLRAAYFGGNWTAVNLKDTLTGTTLEQVTTQVYDLNTIATLFHHLTYYTREVTPVLQGQPLLAKDADSFQYPPLTSQQDWDQRLEQAWEEAETFAQRIEALPDSQLDATFVDEKYGTYFRNLSGLIEHLHYHLGQIVLIKKIITQTSTT